MFCKASGANFNVVMKSQNIFTSVAEILFGEKQNFSSGGGGGGRKTAPLDQLALSAGSDSAARMIRQTQARSLTATHKAHEQLIQRCLSIRSMLSLQTPGTPRGGCNFGAKKNTLRPQGETCQRRCNDLHSGQ